MNKLFFSARDIRDYLTLVTDVKNLSDISDFPPNCLLLTDSPEVKYVLSELMSTYEHYAEGIDSSIIGETNIEGLRLDFNFGLRIDVPEGNFHLTIGDFDSGMVFLDEDLSNVRLISVEKYFIRWQVKVFLDGEEILSHVLNLKGQPVLITLIKRMALGDALAFLPSVVEFKRYHDCDLKIWLPEYLREIAAHLYPDIAQTDTVDFESYATYSYEMYGGNFPFCFDFRNTPIDRVANFILGVNTLPAKPIFRPTAPRICAEPYVCISVFASSNRKAWLYPDGWDIVVDYLKSIGYRVFCIDKQAEQNNDDMTIRKPEGAEDFTGDLPLMERANMIYHAEFFIGLSSGLSWLADAVNCPVVMICGFSQSWCEFYTPYRVANRLVCNGCFNDLRVKFLKKLCPYHHGTPRELECQKKISPLQVLDAIDRLIMEKNLTPPDMRK